MKVLAVTGFSGSGKTTLIVELIARLRGTRVAAIKHTHHALPPRVAQTFLSAPPDENVWATPDRVDEARAIPDTTRFLNAGAHPVILAGDGEAIVFADDATRVTYRDPCELLAHVANAEVVLIEGFKSYDGWPRIDAGAVTAEDAMAILDRIDGP
jgi:molybdopterin-guanine dinucleotide biosynthesis protein